MRFTSILKFPKNIKDFENLQLFNKPKQATFLDYVIWLQKDKDLTFKGLRKHIDQTHLDAIKEVNKYKLK
jgi:hypothetical protein